VPGAAGKSQGIPNVIMSVMNVSAAQKLCRWNLRAANCLVAWCETPPWDYRGRSCVGSAEPFSNVTHVTKPYPGSALADNVQDQVPRTLDDWANFDYVAGGAGTWVSSEVYRRVERFKFYNSMAWGPETRARRPLQRIARWRARNDWYAFPVEKFLVEKLRPAEPLS
jgi:hypothetical protein